MKDHSLPKYMQLKKEIQSWIFTGKLKRDDQLPSEKEMSDRFQFSRQTVRQAIGDMVQAGTLYRIQGKGTFVANQDERPGTDVTTIGLITAHISEYIFPLIVRGAEATLRDKGYRLLLSGTANDKIKERESLEMMMQYALSGLIIEPTKSAEGNPNLDHYLSLEARGIPYVMTNETYPELNCPVIKVDDELGGFLATEHLIQLGHRNIACFFKVDDNQGVNRLKGFLRAHREYDVPLSPGAVVRYTTQNKYVMTKQRASEMLRQAKGRPTAFVCHNDEMAVILLDVVRGEGMTVPNDLSITGFDDSFFATATEVKLTTLTHPKIEMGIQAASLLIELIEKKREWSSIGTIMHKPELIIRNSTMKI